MKTLSKSESKIRIEEFFNNLKDKTPAEIRKIKKLAMKHNVQLKNFRKKFCKKCYSAYRKPKVRIKKGIKSVTCENCGNVSRWEMR